MAKAQIILGELGGGGIKLVKTTETSHDGTNNYTVNGISKIHSIYGMGTGGYKVYAYLDSDDTYKFDTTSPTYFNITSVNGNSFVYTQGSWGSTIMWDFIVIGE